jgi:hypothetical protein
MMMQVDEQLFVSDDFGPPRSGIEPLQLIESGAWEIKSGPINVLVSRHPADGCLFTDGTTTGALDDPLQDAQILAKSRP